MEKLRFVLVIHFLELTFVWFQILCCFYHFGDLETTPWYPKKSARHSVYSVEAQKIQLLPHLLMYSVEWWGVTVIA